MNAMREGQASEKQGWKSGPSSLPTGQHSENIEMKSPPSQVGFSS